MELVNGLWMCHCCLEVFHSSRDLPVNQFGDELFECALCDVVNHESTLSEAPCLI